MVQQYVALRIKPNYFAAPATSMLHDLAMEECRDLHTHGEYFPGAIDHSCLEAIGKGTAIDSLAAVKHLIFDTKKLTWDRLMEALENNWQGHEAIRQMCLNAPKYGNGIEWVDAIGFEIERVLLEYLHRHPKLTDKDTIVLGGVDNKTGDAVFDGALREGLAAELEQSPFLSLVSDEKIQQTLALMNQKPDARLTPQTSKEVCERIGSAAVIDGTITAIGSQYVLGLNARNCQTGDELDREQAPAARKEDVLNALGQIGPAAKKTLLVLMEALHSATPEQREIITAAIQRIRGDKGKPAENSPQGR